MIVNHTEARIFDRFVSKNQKIIESIWPDSGAHLQIFTIHQYSQLKDVPVITFSEVDTFTYAAKRTIINNKEHYFYAIIYSPQTTKELGFTELDYFSAIAHEIGHLKNFMDPFIPNEGWYAEIKADEVACAIGLCRPLVNLLSKLLNQDVLTEFQIREIEFRLRYLKQFLN